MNKEMTPEQYFSFIWGQITAFTYVCGILVSKHPERAIIIQAIKKLPEAPFEDISKPDLHEYYINGIKRVVESLENLSKIAVLVEQGEPPSFGKNN